MLDVADMGGRIDVAAQRDAAADVFTTTPRSPVASAPPRVPPTGT